MAWSSSLIIAAAAVSARADETTFGVDQGGTVPVPPSAAAESLIAPEPPAIAASVAAPSRLRKWGSLGGVTGVYASAATYMYFAWYHGQPNLPSFKFGGDGYFGEDTYAAGVDKLGHGWANLMLSRLTSEILIWGGWKPWKAGLLASSMTLGLFTLFEVKDGFYYEFSPGDAVFNTLGAGLNVAMLACPPLDELIDFRVEYFPSKEYLALLDGKRPPEDPGMPRQISLNFVEDYSGQRYLLALHLGALPWLRGHTWARLVDVAVGYESDKYKPDPIDADVGRSQHLFLGLSVNMQGVIDLALADRQHVLARKGAAVGHLVFELLNPPFGSAAVVGATRSADAPLRETR
jgi:hypothetical protein